jgi:hydrogenase expression/formation protein HypC
MSRIIFTRGASVNPREWLRYVRVLEIHGFEARCVAKGIERTVNLFMLQHEAIAAGDHLLIHVGYAIQKLRPEDAQRHWEALDEVCGHDGDPVPGDA